MVLMNDINVEIYPEYPTDLWTVAHKSPGPIPGRIFTW